MNDTSPARVQIGDSVIYQKLQDEVVLLNMESQHYFGLDGVGAAMWEALLRHGDVESAAASLHPLYQVDQATLRSDLQALVGSLVTAGLLKSAT